MRNGIDTVETSRIEKLLGDLDEAALRDFFSEEELNDAGKGSGPVRAQKLAARFAAKEACCKLFPKEICLGTIEPYDFSVSRDGYGQPRIVPSERARAVMNRHLIRNISLSMTHTNTSATAIASIEPGEMNVPWYGKFIYHVLPLRRRVVMENLRRVFGETLTETQIVGIAQSFYGHLVKFFGECMLLPFLSNQKKTALICIEGVEHLNQAREKGKGVLLLAGHFGNWKVSTSCMSQINEYYGLYKFMHRTLKPRRLNDFLVHRFRKAGFGTIDDAGSLDEFLEQLEQNKIVVSIFDRFTGENYATPSEFFGHFAHTSKNLAVLAESTGAPVIPISSWREADGTHVLCFEAPVVVVTEGRTRDLIALNTRRFNEVLERIILRHPEQWIWMHKRWKAVPKGK